MLAALLLSPGDPLTAAEVDGGVLLQLDPTGLAATVRGATLYYD
jgi:hypothetical protein